jgi:tight adherence protein B
MIPGDDDLQARAEALRALAALLRIGLSPRVALFHWHERAHVALQPSLKRAARRLFLGAPTENVTRSLEPALGEDAGALATIFEVISDLGGDIAAMVDGLARSVEQRAAARSSARVAGSGARVSGRLIAGLPLAFLPLAPLSRAPLFDAGGLFLLSAGVALALTGMLWIARLVPRPDANDDPAAAVADLAAAVLTGGASLGPTLDAISSAPPAQIAADMGRARRWVRLGLTWSRALERLPPGPLSSLGAAIRHAEELGLPVADSLRLWAVDRRAEKERSFDAATKKASVLMMIPLALCVLPSFILLGVAPFLRGLSLG